MSIVEHFGQNIVSSDSSIDRAAWQGVFRMRARDWLNQVNHPAVIEYIRDTIRQNRTRSGILLIETALMYETGCDSLCDEVWLVYVPEEERIRRLASDRGYSEQKSKAIIQSQISETLLREKVQRIVPNDGTKEDLERALDALLTTLDTTALAKG
ncbi:MAG: dephospho-CoA kinase [Clostridium sp.]